MSGYTTPLATQAGRMRAHQLVQKAPADWLCRVEPPKRTLDQNDKLWAMLGDVSVSKPNGRRLTPEQWKCVFMQACGWEVQFLEGLDGQPFPAGFRSSRMTKKQMSDLIEFIQSWGDQNGVRWLKAEAA